MKPDVVLGAMDLYPDTAINLTPMLAFDGDVSAYPKLRLSHHPWPLRKQTVLHITTRAMVFKPTVRTKDFLCAWRHELRTATYHQGGCEMAMRFALMRSTGLAFCPMDARYSGREIDKAPTDAVVIHSSAGRGKRR